MRVLGWNPVRLRLAMMCDAAACENEASIRAKIKLGDGWVFPVVSVGGL